jgi:hypothetical protein
VTLLMCDKKTVNCHVRWLREMAERFRFDGQPTYSNTCEGAANEIEALQAHRDNLLSDIERLRAALEGVATITEYAYLSPTTYQKLKALTTLTPETGVKPE